MASALRGHVLGGKLDPVRLDEAVEDFTAFRIERHQMTGLLGYMLDLRDNFTVYERPTSSSPGLEAPWSRGRKLREGRDSGSTCGCSTGQSERGARPCHWAAVMA